MSKILIADDSTSILESLSQTLEQEGFEIITVEDPEFTKVTKLKPDALWNYHNPEIFTEYRLNNGQFKRRR